MKNRVARYHNIFGPEGTWDGGKEKAPAAVCRKIARAKSGDTIDLWGDGKQTRSFLFVDECVEGTLRLTRNPDFEGPVNIGSDEMVTINQLVDIVADIAGKKIEKNHIPGPTGVRGRNSKIRSFRKSWAGRLRSPCVRVWKRPMSGSNIRFAATRSDPPDVAPCGVSPDQQGRACQSLAPFCACTVPGSRDSMLGKIKGLFTPHDTSTDEGRVAERNRRAKMTAMMSMLAKMISVATQLISVPIALHYLGPERYGMWIVLSTFVIMLGFADLGIGNGILNSVAAAKGRNDVPYEPPYRADFWRNCLSHLHCW
jgi:hypothetical protein